MSCVAGARNELVGEVDKAEAPIFACFSVVGDVDTGDWPTCLEQLLQAQQQHVPRIGGRTQCGCPLCYQ